MYSVLSSGARRRLEDCWLISIGNSKFRQCIAMRPDMVVYSDCECIVYFIGLTTPFEEAIKDAFERQHLT